MGLFDKSKEDLERENRQLREQLRQARSAGITKEEAMEMVQKLYEEEMK